MSVQNPGTPEPAKVDTPVAPPATTPAAAPATTPPPVKSALLTELEQVLGDKAPAAYAHIQELRAENKSNRLDSAEKDRELSEAKAKIAEMERKAKEAEDEKLKQANDYKALYEREVTERQEQLRVARKGLIDKAIETEATKEGIHPKLLKLVDKRGIVVDEEGNVSGVRTALAKFKEENEDLLAATKQQQAAAAAAAADGAQVPPAGAAPSANDQWYNTLKVPGTNMTYAEHARMTAGQVPTGAAAGTPPTPRDANGGAQQKPDHRKMTRKESEEWFKNYTAKLPK